MDKRVTCHEIPNEYITIQEETSGKPNIKIMSYNILESLSGISRNFPYASSANLDIKNRRAKIIAEITLSSPDIICLQEVDFLTVFYKPSLESLGYSIIFQKKTFFFSFEGCLIAYKKTMFKEGEILYLELDKVLPAATEKCGNVATFVELKSLQHGFTLAVVNTHLFYKPEAEDIRFGQISYILNKLAEWEGKKKPNGTLLCGDLNAFPKSIPIRRIYNSGNLPELAREEHSPKVNQYLGEYPGKVSLKSAYEKYQYKLKGIPLEEDFESDLEARLGGHPNYTCYGNEGEEMLDYIFHSETISVTKILKIPEEKLVKLETALPSTIFPSDHLRIEAIIQINV